MTTSLTKSAKNDFINEEHGVYNSIGERARPITNDKILEESASRARESVDEDAVKKDVAATSAMSRRLSRVRIRSSRRVNQVKMHRDSISPDNQSRCRVSGVQNLSFSV